MNYRALSTRRHGAERIAVLERESDCVLARGRPGGKHVETLSFVDAEEARVLATLLLEAAEKLKPARARARCGRSR